MTSQALYDAYFMQRLAQTRQAQQMSASLQFDLARSAMSDDDLEYVAKQFGAPEERGRFGFSEVFRDLLSREPKSFPVSDLKEMQSRLQALGYAPPEAEITGQWTPEWNGYFRRFDQDNYERFLSGKHWLATDTHTAESWIMWTLPSRVFQGIVGAAKGFVEQTPETVSRVGALGGAAGGALIGTAIAPGVGTAVGAGVGALVGLFGDILTSSPEEADDSYLERLVDPFTPFEEYASQGSKAFWEDVGWVGTAASLGAGAKLGIAGVQGAIGAAKATAAAEGSPFLAAALKTAPLEEPTIFGRVTGWAARPFSPSNQFAEWTKTSGLVAKTNNPLLKGLRSAYTGAFTGQFASRGFASLGSGESETKIERAIRETPTLPGWVDFVDFVIWPQKWLPFEGKKILGGVNKLLGDGELLPLIDLVQSEQRVGTQAAKGIVEQVLGDSPVERALNHTRLRLEYGIERRAAEMVSKTGLNPSQAVLTGARRNARAQIIRELQAEAIGRPELTAELAAHTSVFRSLERQSLDALDARFVRAPGPGHTSVQMQVGGRFEREAEKIRQYTLANGGATYSPVTGGFHEGTGYGVTINHGTIRWVTPEEMADPEVFSGIIRDFTDEWYDILTVKGNHIGMWHDVEETGMYALDVSEVVHDFDLAMKLGGIRRQKAITDFAALARGDFDNAFPAVTPIEEPSLAAQLIGYSYASADDPTRGIFGFESWLKNLGTKGRGIEKVRNWLEAERLAARVQRGVREGTIDMTSRISPTTKGGFRRTQLRAEIDRLDKQANRLEEWAALRERDPSRAVAAGARVRAYRSQADALRTELKEISGGLPRNREDIRIIPERFNETEIASPTTGEILAKVNDTPSSEELRELGTRYKELARRVQQSWRDENDMAHAIARLDMETFVDELATRGIIPRAMAERAKISAPSKQIEVFLKKSARLTAKKVELPEDIMAEFHALGYRPVQSSEDILMTDQMPMFVEAIGLGDYTRRHAFWESLGLGLKSESDWTLFQLRSAHEAAELEQVLASEGFRMKGDQALRRLYTALRAKNHDAVLTNEGVLKRIGASIPVEAEREIASAVSVGPGVKTAKGWHLYAVDVRQLSVNDIDEVFGDIRGWTPQMSYKALGALKRGASLGGEWHPVRHPVETAHSLGRVMRVNGLPGFADLVRTWHTKNPGVLERRVIEGRVPEMRFSPPSEELAKSASRQTYIEKLREVTVTNQIPRSREKVTVMMLDALATGAVKNHPDIYPDVETFYSKLHLLNPQEYAPVEGELLKKLTNEAGEWAGYPDVEYLKTLSLQFEDTKEWYGESADAFTKIFAGHAGKTLLRNGEEIDDLDILLQFIAASSPRKDPFQNLAIAAKSLSDYKADPGSWQARGVMPSVAKMMEDIVNGRTIPKWRNEAGGFMADLIPVSHSRRKKVSNFYLNLVTELNKVDLGSGPLIELPADLAAGIERRVTVDTWIGRLFNLDVDNGGKITAKEYNEITAIIQDVADELGWFPRQVQAALWRAAKEDLGGSYLSEARVARAAGREGEANRIEAEARKLLNSDSYAEVVKNPGIRRSIDEILNGRGLTYLQQVKDEVRGAVTFGEDYHVILRYFKTADAATFLHEQGHLLRRLLPAEDQASIQKFLSSHGGGRAAEEAFAEAVEQYFAKRLAPDMLSAPLAGLREATGQLWARFRGHAVDKNLVPKEVRRTLDAWFDDILPAEIRHSGIAAKRTLIGAGAGAALGAYEGDDRFGDALRGAMMGAAAGAGYNKLAKLSYGYLPDYLTRMNSALRYTLSFTFDLGRYSEQNLIAATKYGLPAVVRPGKYLLRHADGWKTPYASERVFGQEAVRDAMRFWDDLNGTTWFQVIDDTDRRLYQAGILGFKPREFEAAQAFMLYQRGWSQDRIREAIANISRYGYGRTALEKSANFIFFPFSFQKKLLLSLSDFVLQAPGRNLLIHEGLRRYHESSFDEKLQDYLDSKAPFLRELARVNNLAFGLSPGRFFLDGIDDHRTNRGKVAQVLASVLVPGGAATPLAQAAGGLGDLSVHAFVPVVVTGEQVDGLEDVVRRYIPLVKDLTRWWDTGGDQLTALTEGAAPYSQFQEYVDTVREYKQQYDGISTALGYQSVDGFLSSPVGGSAASGLEALRMQLADQVPTGFEMAQEFENRALIDQKAILDLARIPDKSPGEEAILQLLERREQAKRLAAMTGLPLPMVMSSTAETIRAEALKYVGDRRFVELWERFFQYEFGPIRRVA